MLYVDGMNGVITHNETIQWLYTLIGSKVREGCSWTFHSVCMSPTFLFILLSELALQKEILFSLVPSPVTGQVRDYGFVDLKIHSNCKKLLDF